MTPMAHAAVIARVCAALSNDQADDARALIATEYPHIPVVAVGRRYSKREFVAVFARDGYIDRYSGQRLVSLALFGSCRSCFPLSYRITRTGRRKRVIECGGICIRQSTTSSP